MTVKELRRELDKLHDDARVLCWDANRCVWWHATIEAAFVNPWTPPDSLLIGLPAHFEDARDCALEALR